MIIGSPWSTLQVVQRFPFHAEFWLPMQPKGKKILIIFLSEPTGQPQNNLVGGPLLKLFKLFCLVDKHGRRGRGGGGGGGGQGNFKHLFV